MEYGIECQTTKDIHLSHGLSALLWLAGIYLVIHSTRPSPARTQEQGAGHRGWFSLVVSYVGQWNHCACVGMCEPQIPHPPPAPPQSPGVICVIITIIILRLQEISTTASEEKSCLCFMMTPGCAYKEQCKCLWDTYLLHERQGN